MSLAAPLWHCCGPADTLFQNSCSTSGTNVRHVLAAADRRWGWAYTARFDQDLTAGFDQDLIAGFDQDLTVGFDQDLTAGLTMM